MSGSIASLTAEAARLRSRMEVLTRQAASGQRAEALGGLAPELPRALALRADLGRREAYGRAMDQALVRTSLTQNALSRLSDIAREFRTDAGMRANSGDPNSLVTLQGRARAALTEVAHLLNTQHAGTFVFGGSDTARPPIPDPNGLATGPMAQDIAAQMNAIGLSGAATVSSQTLAIASSTAAGYSPFSPFLEDPLSGGTEVRRGVPAGDGEVIGYGISANRNAEAVSSGVTTGAWARDLLRNLMSVAALTPAQMAAPAEFDATIADIRKGFQSAEAALGEEAGALGAVEARIETAQKRHLALSNALSQQLGGIQEVDLAETLTRLQATRTTLEASYRAIGSLSELSLAKFLR